jgi:hypothetical protein
MRFGRKSVERHRSTRLSARLLAAWLLSDIICNAWRPPGRKLYSAVDDPMLGRVIIADTHLPFFNSTHGAFYKVGRMFRGPNGFTHLNLGRGVLSFLASSNCCLVLDTSDSGKRPPKAKLDKIF